MKNSTFRLGIGTIFMLTNMAFSMPADTDAVDIMKIAQKCSQSKQELSPKQLAKILGFKAYNNISVLAAMAYTLQYSNDPKAIQELDRLASSENKKIRGVAIFAKIIKKASTFKLTKQGKAEKKKFLFSQFTNSENEWFQIPLAIKLGDLYGDEVCTTFLKVLKNPKNSLFYLLKTELIYQIVLRANSEQLKELYEYVKTIKNMDENLNYFDEDRWFFSNLACETLPQRPILPYREWVETKIKERMKELSDKEPQKNNEN